MKTLVIIFYLFTFSLITIAQIIQFRCGDTIVDNRDSQKYPTVLIGKQCWMARNLNVGVPVNNFNHLNNRIIEKTCYDNSPENCKVYGGLYIWDEAMDWQEKEGTQGICLTGWHIPANNEWNELNKYLGIDSTGQKMKVGKGFNPKWDGTNESGFTALPAGTGHRNTFGRMGKWAVYWTSTQKDKEYAWFTQLDNHWEPGKYTILLQGDYYLKVNGFSIRCILDK